MESDRLIESADAVRKLGYNVVLVLGVCHKLSLVDVAKGRFSLLECWHRKREKWMG